MEASITLSMDDRPGADELLAFYERHGHPNRPTREQVSRMIGSSHCFATARRDGVLIGFARGVTDGLLGRLAECKLDPAYQGPAAITRKDARIEHDAGGVAARMARGVIEALRNYGVQRIEAVAYGTEVDFCEELGFRKMSGVVALGLSFGDGGRESAAMLAAATS